MFEAILYICIGLFLGIITGIWLEREVNSKPRITAMENHIAELGRILISKIEK